MTNLLIRYICIYLIFFSFFSFLIVWCSGAVAVCLNSALFQSVHLEIWFKSIFSNNFTYAHTHFERTQRQKRKSATHLDLRYVQCSSFHAKSTDSLLFFSFTIIFCRGRKNDVPKRTKNLDINRYNRKMNIMDKSFQNRPFCNATISLVRRGTRREKNHCLRCDTIRHEIGIVSF